MKYVRRFLLAGILLANGFAGQSQINKQQTKSMKVLFVLTSHSELGSTGQKTGFWIEEFATPYYFLLDKGVEVTIASPKGGQPPVDPKSNSPEYSTASTVRFYADKTAQDKLNKSVKIEKINQKEYDAVFYPGGHGPMWDLAEDKQSIKLIESFYNESKPIAFVCHAPAALKNVNAINGEPLIKGKKVSGFTNTEEQAVQLTNVVPFLLEDMLKSKGATYERGADWQSFAVTDGLLITGQNPASSGLVAEKLLNLLSKAKK